MLDSLRPAYWVTKREVRDQFRDWRITIPIMFLTAVFPFIMNFTANQLVGFVSRYGANLIAERLLPFFLLVVGFFPITVSLVIALESFVGEKERGSIEPLLTSPLEDWQLYIGKLVAVMVPPLFGSYLGIGVYLLSAYIKWDWTAPLDLLVLIFTLTMVQAFVMVSGAVVVSTQTTTIRSANLLASFIIIPIAFLIQGEAVVMFWGNYQTLWWAVFGLLIIAVLLTRTGISHFNREELLGRELDVLNIKWMWQVFKNQFIGEAISIRAWFRIEVKKTLKELRVSIFLALILLIGAVFIGVHLASEFVIPPDLIQLDGFDFSVFEGTGDLSIISTNTAFTIWLHNIRAILLGVFLGIFSFGIFGILALMVPISLIGYSTVPIEQAGLSPFEFLAAFILPHGIFEIPAIILSTAVLLKLGAGLVASNKGKSIGEAMLSSLADWAKIMLGVIIPLLFLAAAMEAFVTPRLAIWLLTR